LDNEVGKGSMSTAFEHGLAGPEGEGNSVHDLEGSLASTNPVYPLNLSISLCGGKETNWDSLSKGD